MSQYHYQKTILMSFIIQKKKKIPIALNGEIIWIDKKIFEKEIHMICLLVVREKRKRKR